MQQETEVLSHTNVSLTATTNVPPSSSSSHFSGKFRRSNIPVPELF